MLSRETLKELLHSDGLSRTDKLLLCLAADNGKPKSVETIRDIAVSAGLPAIQKWNVSSLLAASRSKAIRSPTGWELGAKGKTAVKAIAGPILDAAPPKAAGPLAAALEKIKDSDAQAFAAEAVACFQYRQYRAAVVLSWVGAVSLLYDHVLKNELPAFNAEASRRNSKWKPAKSRDDLALLNEFDFLQVLEAISVIGKSVKHELEGCLKFRNGCGHPNSLQIGESRVSAHVEVLLLNVFSKFSI